MAAGKIYVWKEAPFLRLLIPFIAGIVIQWYGHLPVWTSLLVAGCGFSLLLAFNRSSPYRKFRHYWMPGIAVNCLCCALGMAITAGQDDAQHPNALKNLYQKNDILVALVQEPLSAKKNTFKAFATIESINRKGTSLQNIRSGILLYFEKDSAAGLPVYGNLIVFRKELQPIKNSGNPDSFDYENYCALQHISYRVYLKKTDYSILSFKKRDWLNSLIFRWRSQIVAVLHRFIKGQKEAGLAEALLIGYRDDLDNTLVQSYSNTGVVHIIAISGLHLALIYLLLKAIFKNLPGQRSRKWIQPLCIIAGLWIFSLLSGASPSVIRSAVMFSCIVVGELFSKKTAVGNTLPASAFLLLGYNPLWLWDAGFQLSYSAVLSIVLFNKPLYDRVYLHNKLLDIVWKPATVSISAQILTTPVSVFLFHQFPVYFLFTNLLAVPLSSLVLLAEIGLCCCSWISSLAKWTGMISSWLITAMNSIIEWIERFPFAVWQSLEINIFQVISMYGLIACVSAWLLHKKRIFVWPSLLFALVFVAERSVSFIQAQQQQFMMVYSIPKHRAIDFVQGRKYVFTGDAVLEKDRQLQNGFIGLTRTYLRISPDTAIGSLIRGSHIFLWGKKRILLVDRPIQCSQNAQPVRVDCIILSGNPKVAIPELAKLFHCPLWVLDASNSPQKRMQWQEECEQTGVRSYDPVDKGAFVMKQD